MGLPGIRDEIPVLRGDLIYRAADDPVVVLDRHAECLGSAGLRFQYFKGNDSLLHYTLVDWSSGVRRMSDIHDRVKAMWSERKHPGEWLYASFLGDFAIDGYSRSGVGFGLDESGLLELKEMSVRLVYNGRAFLGCETYSIASTCRAPGLIRDGSLGEHERNLSMILDGLIRTWLSTAPLLGWIGTGKNPYVDVQRLTGTMLVPPQAWFLFYPSELAPALRDQPPGVTDHLLMRELEDGSVLVENVKRRPGELGYL